MTTTLAVRFGEAMRRTASGVAVLATDGPAGRSGVTISTLCSLSMEPPSIIACVHRASKALPIMLENGVFTANALAEDQLRIAQSFAGQIPELRDDRFASGTWEFLSTGAPALKNALSTFDCRISTKFDFGSHCIVVGEVIDLKMQETMPLLYSNRTFCRLTAISGDGP
jgi:flavin reductase (DIM6/NTAB) family NADH-FMN oxidoreductase RutF